MKKLLLVLALSLSLGACSVTTAVDAVKVATVGVQNPVTKKDLYNFQNGMIVAFAGLNAYKKACVSGAIPASCVGVIHKLQVYTKQLPPVLRTLRQFVKNNDQVNARVAYNTARQLLNDFKAVAAANNVKVQ